MDNVEARLKIVELAASMVETHVKAVPDRYTSKDEVTRAFDKFFDAIYKNFVKIAPKTTTKPAPKPIDKA